MFKKIVIFGLLATAQISLGMEDQRAFIEIEKEYAQWDDAEPSQGFDYEKEQQKLKRKEYMDSAKTVATEYAKSYAAAYSLIFAHEFGHWSFARALLKHKGFIWVSPLQFLPWFGFEGVHYHMPTSEVIKHFINNPKDIFKAEKTVSELAKKYDQEHLMDKLYSRRAFATMLAAGPISGCIASYLLLKGNTFLNEYEKNSRSIKSAWQETQEKSLFNRDQNFLLQIIAMMNIQVNLFNSFYPWGNRPTQDGDRIFDVLNIKNPWPLLRKTIGMSLGTLTFCALGKAIFDAWTK